MATISAPIAAAKWSLGFHGLSTRTTTFPTITVSHPTTSIKSVSLKFKHAVTMRAKQRLPLVFASNIDPSDSNPVKEKSNGIEAKDSAQGPPFLTILAGFVVLLLVFWILGSVIMWLVGLAVNLSPSK